MKNEKYVCASNDVIFAFVSNIFQINEYLVSKCSTRIHEIVDATPIKLHFVQYSQLLSSICLVKFIISFQKITDYAFLNYFDLFIILFIIIFKTYNDLFYNIFIFSFFLNIPF